MICYKAETLTGWVFCTNDISDGGGDVPHDSRSSEDVNEHVSILSHPLSLVTWNKSLIERNLREVSSKSYLISNCLSLA